MKMTGSQALVESFLHEGVDILFGYPGGAIIPVFDCLYDYREKIKQILTRHEQGATHAAQGYARVSGKVGAVIVTSGPAATNIVTGVADAMIDSTPMVVVTGQIVSSLLGTDAFQETDVVGITQPVTKWSYQIRRAEDVPWAVARAFFIARSGRPGPVVLDFTKDAQVGLLAYHYKPCTFIRSYVDNPTIDYDAIITAAALINKAEKPLAIVGQGVILGNAEKELLQFIKKADIPVAATLLGLSAISTTNPLYQGMVGMHGNIAPNIKTNECDLLIAIGMRFDDRVTGNLKSYAPQAKVIHFDIDITEFDKNVKTDVAILGNVKQTLPAVTSHLENNKHTSWIESFADCYEVEKRRIIIPEIAPVGKQITMGEVVKKVSDATKNNAVLVTDVGQNQMFGARYFGFTQTRSMITSGGLGTMGFGLPAAIGAALGAPDRTICLLCGDGGIQMTIQELGTIMQLKLPIKIIILNNSFLGMVRQWQELFYNAKYSMTEMDNPNFVALAAAYRIPGKEVIDREDLQPAIDEMLATDGAYLLHVRVEEKGMVFPMIPAGGCVSNILLNPTEKFKL